MEFNLRAKLEKIIEICSEKNTTNNKVIEIIYSILDNEDKKIIFKSEEDEFIFDSENHVVFFEGKKIKLKVKESSLLRYILLHKNGLMTRNKILDAVWENENVTDRNVDVQIHKLKRLIPYILKNLKTVRSHGYVFEDR